MQQDVDQLFRRIQALSDRELIRIVERDADQYHSGALSIAEEEVASRGGLAHLKKQAYDPSESAYHSDAKERLSTASRHVDRWLSKLMGRTPSERYPALSHVATVMRLLSFLCAAVTVIGTIGFPGSLFGGDIALGALIGVLYGGVAFLLLFGGSEVINVVMDIEKNTREARGLLQSERGRSGEENASGA